MDKLFEQFPTPWVISVPEGKMIAANGEKVGTALPLTGLLVGLANEIGALKAAVESNKKEQENG
jgi:hypothetical protein